MNNDRFKFRVWDEAERRYHYNDFVVTATGYIAKAVVDSLERTYIDQTDMDYNRMVLEQCTGLRDKNGNLIYIGDIIKCGNGPLSTATVQYENGENFIDGIYPFNLYHDCGDECHCQLRDYPEYACEIIGNIHEQRNNK